MKRLLKDKRGMSLMEILVAFTLLMILIVGTTPVMLTAYNGLYRAGESTQDTYEAKTEIENQLATRTSTIELNNFGVGFIDTNFNNLGEVVQINAKRAISSLVYGLETVFTGGRARLTIISGDTVNDDSTTHQIVVQVTNYKVTDDEVQYGGTYTKDSPFPTDKKLIFQAILPKKTEHSEESVYPTSVSAQSLDVEADDDMCDVENGRFVLNISTKSGQTMDFTTSPIKICIWYLDEEDTVLSASDYLYIKPATIIAAGKTNGYDYYTSAGVVAKEDGTPEIKFVGRKMTTENITGTVVMPDDTVIKSVNWVNEYGVNVNSDGEIEQYTPNVPYDTAYYVLTGTNGAIYRTYSFNKVGQVNGKVDLSMSDNDRQYYATNGVEQEGERVVNPTEEPYNIENGAVTVYPAVWGGDFSHIYAYSTYKDQMGYIGQDTWYTQSAVDSGEGQPGYYSNKANYCYYYNGFGMDFTPSIDEFDTNNVAGWAVQALADAIADAGQYYTQNSKKLSYILTEKPYAMRVGGLLGSKDDYSGHHNRIWEKPTVNLQEDTLSPIKRYDKGNWITKPGYKDDGGTAWYYKDSTKSFYQSVVVQNDDENSGFSSVYDCNSAVRFTGHEAYTSNIPVYFVNKSTNILNLFELDGNRSRRKDEGLAQIRIKALTTMSPTFVYYRWKNSNKDGNDTQLSDVEFVYNHNKDDAEPKNNVNLPKIAITDSVYIPGRNGETGEMFYIGTVAAYGFLHQTDNMETDTTKNPDTQRIYNNGSDNTGGITSYFVMANDENTQTTIWKYSAPQKGTGNSETHTRNREMMLRDEDDITTDAINVNSASSHEFFVNRSVDTETGKLFSDLLFTMGFASNREMVYSKIVYGKDEAGNLQEALKSFEPYYFQSHHDNENHTPNYYMFGQDDTYLNSPENDYYNIWFPGEMYNLTKVATKDDITVAVGYAVSGSSYTWSSTPENVSTGLGSIYNDGVLSAMVLGTDTSFTNLLYYKEQDAFVTEAAEKFDAKSLSGTTNINKNGNYGTHARNSVQFTAVDISIEKTNIEYETKTDGSKVIKSFDEAYYAYYADNRGRVFRSLVATRDGETGVLSRVDYIADANRTGVPSYMEEQKVGTNSIGTYFEKITSINVSGDLIIVTGHPEVNKNKFYIAVGEISGDGTAPTWKVVTINGGTARFKSNDGLVLDGYLYVVGHFDDVHSGWINATAISDLKTTTGPDTPIDPIYYDTNIPDELYAIDGHS